MPDFWYIYPSGDEHKHYKILILKLHELVNVTEKEFDFFGTQQEAYLIARKHALFLDLWGDIHPDYGIGFAIKDKLELAKQGILI